MGLFNLIFTLGVNRKPMEKDLKAAEKTLNNFAANIKGQLAGAFTIGTVVAFARSIHDTVNRVKDLSEQFNITTDEVQKTDFALKQSGMQFEDLGAAMNRLASGRRDAVEGNRDLESSFAKMGITLQDLNNPQVRTFDLLVKIAGALAQGNVTGREQVLVMDLLGAKAGKLANVLGELESINPPVLIKPADIKAIDDAAKAYERMVIAAKALGAGPLSGVYGNIEGTLNRAKAGDVGGMARQLNPLARINDLIFGKFFKDGIFPGKQRDATAAGQASIDFAEALGSWFNTTAQGGMWERDADVKEKRGKIAKQDFDSFSRPSDSLVSVGNFLGGDPSASFRSQINQVHARLMRIEQNTKRTADNAIIIRK